MNWNDPEAAFACPNCFQDSAKCLCPIEGKHYKPIPSPASPAVGGEEEAKKYAHQKCEEFLAAHGSLPYGFHGFAKGIYLAGFSRGGEVEREKSENAMRAAIGAKDAAVECAAALKQERDEACSGREENYRQWTKAALERDALAKQLEEAKAEIERLNRSREKLFGLAHSKDISASMSREDAETIRTTLEAVEKERDELREGIKQIGNLPRGGDDDLARAAGFDMAEWRQIARSLLASRAEPPSGERGSGA